MSSVLARLRDLDPMASLQAGYVHRVVRHALLWFADLAGPGSAPAAGVEAALPPGVCSNPEPPRAILDIALAPLDIAHYWLAQIAFVAGFPEAVPDPHTRLSGEPILALEVSLRRDRLVHSIVSSNPVAFLDNLSLAFAARLAMPRLLREPAKLRLDDWERGHLPPADANDPGFVPFVRNAVFSFQLHAILSGKVDACDTLRTVVKERDVAVGSDVISLMFPPPGSAGARSPEKCLGLLMQPYLSAVDLLECCLRIGIYLERSDLLPLVGPSFVRWAKREWLRLVEERSFDLRTPRLTAPAIVAAAKEEGENIAGLAKLLDAAVSGVSIIVAGDLRQWIRSRATTQPGG